MEVTTSIIRVFFIVFILISVGVINGSIGSYTVLKVPSVTEAAFAERLSNSLPETEYHECNVPERELEICEDVALENEFCKLHKCKFIEGKTMGKKQRFLIRQSPRRASKDIVINLCKCPSEPSIYIQDNVYSNDITVFIDTSQVSP